MRRIYSTAVAAVLLLPSLSLAQGDTEKSRAVAGGGISIAGWAGKIDAREEAGGAKLSDAKLSMMGKDMMVTTGPATTYWNPANKASGNYTVKATFNEPKYQNLNDHPHPYGIMIAGNDLGTDQQSYLYCAVNGNGTFIARGFSPMPAAPRGTFQLNGGRGEASEAIHKAAGVGQPVTNEVAVSVKGDKVECAINGTVVGSYNKADLVTAGKLKSTDGVYGIRFAHNTEAMVSGFTMVKN